MSKKIGIPVYLKEDFSVVRETLERVGIINKKKKIFVPSCYVLGTEDEDIYRIVHFKELFPLVNRESNYDEDDKLRRNTIIYLLKNWKLVEPLDQNDISEFLHKKIPVLPHSQKDEYKIIHKFKFSKRIILEP
ncbi:MAG: translational repressor RegA [Atribacterota bacterium]